MADIQTWTVTEPYVDCKCRLGEGPYYEKKTNTLRFVDIKGWRLHSVDLSKGPSSLTTVQLDTPISVTADIEGVDPADKILIGAKFGLAILDRKTGKYEYLAKLRDGEPNKRLRGNDGAVDPNGRMWLGTMSDFDVDLQPEGSLFVFDKSGRNEFLKDILIPNSIGFSPDNKTMYFTDSMKNDVLAFDYDAATGAVSNRRVFYHHASSGGPDGFRVDREGNVWHAIYGESRVVKISPDGRLVGQVLIPTRNATCVQFVGTTLWITTAGDDEGEGRSKELGGGLFCCDVGVEGLEPFEFKM